MGHAHHFLSRLDRVSLPHVELALELYNDVPLLRYILEKARVPEGAARVAISLDHPEDGPFLIVTRDGHFVTCLGKGMSPGDLPVITRAKLDSTAEKASDLRARMEACRRLAGPNGGVGKLLRRIHEAGDELSREEIAAFIGLQPLYAFEFFRFLFAAGTDLSDTRDVLLSVLKRTDRLRPHYRDVLRSYWQTFWSIGHFSVLVAADGRELIDHLPKDLTDVFDRASLSWAAVRQGMMPLAVRGIWAVGRIGKPLLAATKHRLRKASTILTLLDAGMGLTTLGLRHAKLRTEVSKALSIDLDLVDNHPHRTALQAIHERLRLIVDADEAIHHQLGSAMRRLGAETWMQLTSHRPEGAPLRFARAEDVPDELAMCAAVNAPLDFMSELSVVTPMVLSLPWLSRATPEQLYLPREALRACSMPWTPDHTLGLLRAHRDFYKLHRAPRARPEGPARKGPCPCGSGKKYKRCCEAEEEGNPTKTEGGDERPPTMR